MVNTSWFVMYSKFSKKELLINEHHQSLFVIEMVSITEMYAVFFVE